MTSSLPLATNLLLLAVPGMIVTAALAVSWLDGRLSPYATILRSAGVTTPE